MIQKLNKDSTRKLKSNIPINIDSKNFNKILENQQHIKCFFLSLGLKNNCDVLIFKRDCRKF